MTFERVNIYSTKILFLLPYCRIGLGRAWRRYAVILSKPYPLTLWNRWNSEKKRKVAREKSKGGYKREEKMHFQ